MTPGAGKKPEQHDSAFDRPANGRASRILDRLADGAAFVACLLLLFQVIAICLDVALRFAFDMPLNGVTAMTEWSLLYVAFLGAAWLQRENGHVRVDILRNALPHSLARVVDVGAILIGLIVTAVLIGFGTWVTWLKLIENEIDFFKLAWMPLYPIYAVIPFGAVLWFLVLLRSLFEPTRPTLGAPDV